MIQDVELNLHELVDDVLVPQYFNEINERGIDPPIAFDNNTLDEIPLVEKNVASGTSRTADISLDISK